MQKEHSIDSIDGYLKSISRLLPYSYEKKTPVLEELRKDIQDAMGSEKRPPAVVFCTPLVVARDLSNAQDWGTQTASWGRRFIATAIDFGFLFLILFAFFEGVVFCLLQCAKPFILVLFSFPFLFL